MKPGPGKSSVNVADDQRRRLIRAMNELAAGGGFESVTVRALTKLAGVSTHTFYDRFDGMEACLLEAHAGVTERLRRDLLASRAPNICSRQQLTRSLAAVFAALAEDPAASRVALIEVYAGGPASIAAVATREAAVASALRECLDRRGARAVAAVSAWVLAGVLYTVRQAFLAQMKFPSEEEIRRIEQWATGLLGTRRLENPSCAPGWPSLGPPSGERDAVLAAVLRIAVDRGYWSLSVPAVCSLAGVTGRAFAREFSNIEDCYLAAIGGLTSTFLPSPDPAVICGRIAAEPSLARLLFVDVLAPGRRGLLTREALVDTTAERWHSQVQGLRHPPPVLSVAALWADLASLLARERSVDLTRRVLLYGRLLRRRPDVIALASATS